MNLVINKFVDLFNSLSTKTINSLSTNSSTLNSLLLISLCCLLILALLLYTFQSRLIYLPQLPPGSRQEVWGPERFGYQEGQAEELVIETPDGEKLQAFWIEAPSKWNKSSSVEGIRARHHQNQSTSETPFTVLYMQANAGNIVTRAFFCKDKVILIHIHTLFYRATDCQSLKNSKNQSIATFCYFPTAATVNPPGHPQNKA